MTASPDGFTATILKYVQVSNLQKITCIILRNLFGLYLFQSCATGTLLLRKKIHPRKYSLNLRQLIFFMLLNRQKWLIKLLITRKMTKIADLLRFHLEFYK